MECDSYRQRRTLFRRPDTADLFKIFDPRLPITTATQSVRRSVNNSTRNPDGPYAGELLKTLQLFGGDVFGEKLAAQA